MLLLLIVDAHGSVRSHACRVGLREGSQSCLYLSLSRHCLNTLRLRGGVSKYYNVTAPQSWLYLSLSRHGLNMLRLRGGVSKYYNVTAPPKRGGIFIEPEGGVLKGEG